MSESIVRENCILPFHTENSVGFIWKINVPRVFSYPDRSGTENQEESQQKERLVLLGQEGEELGKETKMRRLPI